MSEENEKKRRERVVRVAASMSFTPAEVAALDALTKTLLRGGDARQHARSPELRSVMRKVEVMKAALDRQREKRAKSESGGST